MSEFARGLAMSDLGNQFLEEEIIRLNTQLEDMEYRFELFAAKIPNPQPA